MARDKRNANMILESIQGKSIVAFEDRDLPEQRWELLIPEVFIAERDDDRFLKSAGPAAQNDPIDVKWKKGGGGVAYTWSTEAPGPIALDSHVSAAAGEHCIDLQFTVKNTGQTQWPKLFSAAACLRANDAPSFHDDDGSRTVLFNQSRPIRAQQLITDEHGRLRTDRCNPESPDFQVGSRMDPATRHLNVDHGLIVRESRESLWKIAFGWDVSARVSTVMTDWQCIHAHPEFARLTPNESVTRYGRIWFTREPPGQILHQYLAFLNEKR